MTTTTATATTTIYTPSEDRYAAAPDGWFRRCGRSGLKLPAISLGCWHNFGDPGTGAARHNDEASMHENARQMLFTAFDAGITHFDLANNYGPSPGAAEARVGRILRDDFASHRDELVISTKAGYFMWPGPYGDMGSRKYLLASLDQSLKRLGVDCVDIFYHHRPDPNTPLDETLGALDQAVRAGKAIYAGVSSYNGALTVDAVRLAEQRGYARPIIHQPAYNMFNRGVEKDLLPQTRKLGLGVIAFCPLAQGLLTDKYLDGIPDDSRAASKAGMLKPEAITPDKLAKIKQLNDLAQQRGQSLAQMALAWTLRDEAVTTALIGASRPEQITQNVAAMTNASFTTGDLDAIETILAG
ncbi:MAG: aldo/keto reductase [Phycisphaeraceae bacterium]